MNAIALIARSDLRVVVRRWWFSGILGIGVLGILFGMISAWNGSGQDQADSFRADVASVYLLAGLAVGLTLGATAFWTTIQSGHLGLLTAAGARRSDLAIGRVVSRSVALIGTLALWTVVAQIGSLAIGRGLDGPLTTHALSMLVTLGFSMLAAAAVSTVLGPAVSGFVGLSGYILIQAVVNLEAAADLGRLETATTGVHIAYNILPRAVQSPMIVDMHNRGQGGPASPQFEINDIPVPLFSAGWTTVLWTLVWCAIMVLLCMFGTRRRTFN